MSRKIPSVENILGPFIDHPWVVFLRKVVKDKKQRQRDDVWIKFIREADPNQDMTLIYDHLIRRMGLPMEHIEGKSPEEILNVLESIQEAKQLRLDRGPSKLWGKKKFVEDVLSMATKELASNYVLPRARTEFDSDPLKRDVISGCEIKFLEHGTLEYTIARKEVFIDLKIPGEWFVKYARPEFDDHTICENFARGVNTLFTLDGVFPDKNSDWINLIKDRFPVFKQDMCIMPLNLKSLTDCSGNLGRIELTDPGTGKQYVLNIKGAKANNSIARVASSFKVQLSQNRRWENVHRIRNGSKKDSGGNYQYFTIDTRVVSAAVNRGMYRGSDFRNRRLTAETLRDLTETIINEVEYGDIIAQVTAIPFGEEVKDEVVSK